jgi:CRISPR-associated endoribonuclease Cas6
MTFTKEIDTKDTDNLSENHPITETKFAGLSVVLRSGETSSDLIPLIEWLANSDLSNNTIPIWIPLCKADGVLKVMPVLPEAQLYPSLMQVICQQIGQNSLVEWQKKPYEVAGVEVDSDSLHTIQVTISAVKPQPPTLGRAIHALCFRWFANTNPEIAASLHQQENLPMTVGLEYCSPKKMLLKISLLKKELLAPLLWGMNVDLGKEITLAGIPCQLGSWVDITQTSSFEKIMQLPTQNLINLQFLSPTSFKQGKNIQPFPLPELVFNGLLRRWNVFAPEKLQFSDVEWSGVVSAYELKTYAMKMEGGAEIGAEGSVKYRFADPEQAKIATILANFACFAGIGRKTGMGMGRVCLG